MCLSFPLLRLVSENLGSWVWAHTLRVYKLVTQSCPTLRPHGLQPTRLPCPWDFPGKDTGVYNVIKKNCLGALAKRRLCLGPAGVMNCPPLSALFWVSLFPRTHGYNIWCTGWETPHLEETSPIWDYSKALQLVSSRGGRLLTLLEGFCFSMPRPFTLAGSGRQQGSWALSWGGTHPAGWKREPDHPPGGTRRGTDPQEHGTGRWGRLPGTQVDEHVRT